MQIKILIVDDDLKIVTMLSKTFTTMLEGYLVLTATSANAGMGMLKEERPDVVILDVRLGPESGMDLLQDFNHYVASQHGRHRPRFIVITAYPDENVRKEALEKYKVDAFLMKPLNPLEMRSKVIESIKKILETELKNLSAYVSEPENKRQERKEVVEKKITEGPRRNEEGS